MNPNESIILTSRRGSRDMMTANSRLFPAIFGGEIGRQANPCIIDEDVYLQTITKERFRKGRNRCKSREVNERELYIFETGGLLYSWTPFRDQAQVPIHSRGDLPCTAASPFSRLRHPRTNLFGFIEAKCFAASKPKPTLAPMTATVLPVRSACTTGSTFQNRSWRKLRNVRRMYRITSS